MITQYYFQLYLHLCLFHQTLSPRLLQPSPGSIIVINQMRKVLIVKEYREVPDVIVVTLKQAEKFIQSLKDAHFEEVVLQAPEEGFNNNKLFIYVPRILRHGGVLKLEGFSKEDQAKVTGVIVGLGLKAEPAETQQTITFSKPNLEGEKVVESQAPLHIGFHAGVTPSEKEKIDEADLLKDDVIVKKSKPEDCAVKPKACANCKCGRKEQQQQQSKQETVKQIQQGTVKSNCGSCYLGDAFRCATCPYKGLPAFKPGDKIEIPNADGVTEASEASVTKVQGGKVKLDLADD